MQNVLMFVMPSDRIFHAEATLDTKTNDVSQLDGNSPFVLVCPTTFLCGYLYDNFLINQNADAYINIEDAGDHPIFSVFLHVRVNPPFAIDDQAMQFIRYLSQYTSFPENNRATDAVYGCIFTATPESVKLIRSNYKKANAFFVSLGARKKNSDMVFTDDAIPVIKGTNITSKTTAEFITFVGSLPSKTP